MRALALWALLCAALGLCLAWTRADVAAPAPEVVHVRDHVRAGAEPVAGLSLAFGPGTPQLTFARARGQWRCLSVWNAPADGARIEALLTDLVEAHGVVRAEDAQDAAWGLEADDALELRLHGRKLLEDPAGDVLLALRFGLPSRLAGATRAHSVGSFARLGDDPRVVELSFEPESHVGRFSSEGLPPLLALRVAPPAFPGAGGPVERVFLEGAQGTLELARSARTPIAVEPGQDPNLALEFAWDLIGPEGPRAIPPLRGEAFATWAPRAPYDLLADPREGAAHGVEPPELRLTLVPAAGEPLVLEIGAADALGRRWVLCRATPQLARVGPEVARMLVPDTAELSDATRPNAWDAWLRAELARR
jgi:hypothetical protein